MTPEFYLQALEEKVAIYQKALEEISKSTHFGNSQCAKKALGMDTL